MKYPTVEYQPGVVRLLDQTRIPFECVQLECHDVDTLIDAIRRLVVRGAPAIGVAAAHGASLAADRLVEAGADGETLASSVADQMARLRAARPTAVNLGWALDRMELCLDRAVVAGEGDPGVLRDRLRSEAAAIHAEDVELCSAMGEHGAALLPDPSTVITHCNTGALATVGIGTALGVVYAAVQAGKRVEVYVDETRPLLQGARLNTWELAQHGIPATLLCDSAAAWLLKNRKVDAALVGADRIAANGDTANKIGTYSLAVQAARHGVPFYVAAPYSTLDLSLASGDEIPIEERDAAEVTGCLGHPVAPVGTAAFNPAFDVTPHELIAGIITERGVFRPSFAKNFAQEYASG